jgi:hypothetical protein
MIKKDRDKTRETMLSMTYTNVKKGSDREERLTSLKTGTGTGTSKDSP